MIESSGNDALSTLEARRVLQRWNRWGDRQARDFQRQAPLVPRNAALSGHRDPSTGRRQAFPGARQVLVTGSLPEHLELPPNIDLEPLWRFLVEAP